MRSNTSVSLGNHFEQFVGDCIAQGRYKNASEVIRAGLRLLEDAEEERLKLQALKAAIKEGDESGAAVEIDFDAFLLQMKSERAARLQRNGKA
jgi:antitoxin ParD1/3/4